MFLFGLVAQSILSLGLRSPSHSQHKLIQVSQLPESSFSIYCTSNLDSTGSCTRMDNNQPISCEMIPGGVINCKQQASSSIQCVFYSGVISTQAYFYCTRRTDPGINENRINNQRFSPVKSERVSPSNDLKNIILPFSEPLENKPAPVNVFDNPIKDAFN